VIPLTLGLLILLFVVQEARHGRVGGFFGPVIILWFATIGLLGAIEIARHRASFERSIRAMRSRLILADPGTGFVLLGGVVLAVTGAKRSTPIWGISAGPDTPRLAALCLPGSPVELICMRGR